MDGAHRAHQQGDRGAVLSAEAGSDVGQADVAGPKADGWGGATYERIAQAFAPIHERIVAELGPKPGERFLDLACGTGGVAFVAARTGAEVIGLDLSPDQIGKARAAAEAEGASIGFDEGDAQALPYAEGEFDAVASAFGMIFAPDHERAAGELARVTRPGGRIAITSWLWDDWARLGERLRPDYEGNASKPWGEEEYVRRRFPGFEISFERGHSTIGAESPEACWELLSQSIAPLKAWLAGLDEEQREHGRQEYLAVLGDNGFTRDYLLTLGTKR